MTDFYTSKTADLMTKCLKYIDLMSRRQEQQTEIQYRILQELKLINENIIAFNNKEYEDD